MKDHFEIERLIRSLGRSLDEGRFDDLRSVFGADAVVHTPGGTAEGVEALVAQARRGHFEDDDIQHRFTDLLIDVDGDDANVRYNAVVAMIRASDEPNLMLGEVYRVRARRTSAGWRIVELESRPIWRLTPERPLIA